MKNILFVISFLIPIIGIAQGRDLSEKKKLDTETIFTYLKPEGGGYYNLANTINGKILLKNYVNLNNKSDTIFLEKIVRSYNTATGGFLIGNEMGSRRGVILSFKYLSSKRLAIDTCEETNYILNINRKNINKHAFYLIETHYENACLEENTVIIYRQLPYGGIKKTFEADNRLEYYNAFNYCGAGTSYTQKFYLIYRKGKIFLKVIKTIESSGKKKDYYYLYQDSKFSLCSKCYPR